MSEHAIAIWLTTAKKNVDWNSHEALLREESDRFYAPLEPHPKHPLHPTYYHLTDAAARHILQAIPKLKNLKFNSAKVELFPTDAETEKAEWFLFTPATDFDIDGVSSNLVELRADRIKGREAVRHFGHSCVAVNETFVEFARKQKFTGIDFLWCNDKGKFAAPQWYAAFSTSFLGRGLDADAFDPTTRGKTSAKDRADEQPNDPVYLRGVHAFPFSQLRKQIPSLSKDVQKVLDYLRTTSPSEGGFKSNFRVLRKYLPDTDFAYLRFAKPPEGYTNPYKGTVLCCSAPTRKKLLAAKLAGPQDFRPIEVLDKPPAGIDDLDAKGSPPPAGMFTPDTLKKARDAETVARKKFDAKPKESKTVEAPSLDKLLPKLKKRITADSGKVNKGASAADITSAEKSTKLKLPKKWAALLSFINGFTIDNCAALDDQAELRVASTNDLPSEHKRTRHLLELPDPKLPKSLLVVATNDLGDGILLDTSKLTKDGDTPVLYISHDDATTMATWPSINTFLAHALDTPNPA